MGQGYSPKSFRCNDFDEFEQSGVLLHYLSTLVTSTTPTAMAAATYHRDPDIDDVDEKSTNLCQISMHRPKDSCRPRGDSTEDYFQTNADRFCRFRLTFVITPRSNSNRVEYFYIICQH